MRMLATPAAFDCLDDVGGGHADSEKDTAQLNHHGRLSNMVGVACIADMRKPMDNPTAPKSISTYRIGSSFTTEVEKAHNCLHHQLILRLRRRASATEVRLTNQRTFLTDVFSFRP